MEATLPTLDEFMEAAHRELSFLIEDYSFREVPQPRAQHKNPFEVHFERAGWRIIIEGLSYGFCAGISIQDPDGRQAAFGHIIPENFFWSYRDGLGRGQLGDIRYCALTLRTFGSDFLGGDTQLFEELLSRQASYIEADRRKMDAWGYRLAASKAAQAFAIRDYDKVVTLLSPHTAHLTEIEERKLDYARRHSKKPA
jgi:hypothetical protein